MRRSMLLAACAFALGLGFGIGCHDDAPLAYRGTSAAGESAPTERAADLARIEREIASLRAELAARSVAPPPPAATAATEKEVAPPEDDSEARQFVELDQRARNEARDAQWSGGTETKIRDVFAAAQLQGTQVASVSCASTLCKVEVIHDSLEAEQRLLPRCCARRSSKTAAS